MQQLNSHAMQTQGEGARAHVRVSERDSDRASDRTSETSEKIVAEYKLLASEVEKVLRK